MELLIWGNSLSNDEKTEYANLEIQNKPFWDEYKAYCAAQEPLTGDELCLDELGFTATPTSTRETSASSSEAPA